MRNGSMDFANCSRCKKVFAKTSTSVCPECEKLEKRQLISLEDYTELNPLATMSEVSDAVGVSTSTILRFVREGFLRVSKGMMEEVRCTQCGGPVDKGVYCATCSAKIATYLKDKGGIVPPPTSFR